MILAAITEHDLIIVLIVIAIAIGVVWLAKSLR